MSDDKPQRIIINHNPYQHGKSARRISDEKLEKISDQHVARMRERQEAGMPHAPTKVVTNWRPFKDQHGERRFYPVHKKIVDFGDDQPKKDKKSKGGATPNFDEKDAQTRMLMEEESRSLTAGGTDIDPMKF